MTLSSSLYKNSKNQKATPWLRPCGSWHWPQRLGPGQEDATDSCSAMTAEAYRQDVDSDQAWEGKGREGVGEGHLFATLPDLRPPPLQGNGWGTKVQITSQKVGHTYPFCQI